MVVHLARAWWRVFRRRHNRLKQGRTRPGAKAVTWAQGSLLDPSLLVIHRSPGAPCYGPRWLLTSASPRTSLLRGTPWGCPYPTRSPPGLNGRQASWPRRCPTLSPLVRLRQPVGQLGLRPPAECLLGPGEVGEPAQDPHRLGRVVLRGDPLA